MTDIEKKFEDWSYTNHIENYKQYSATGEKSNKGKKWLDYDTVDAWRHQRMYQVLDPILNSFPNAKWLTIGDGRYGNDSRYIEKNGGHALATDISDYLLKEAVGAGFISNFKQENAESLSFSNESFDYVLCKESYHHFPRPMIALYEMLRVARDAVILIEPNDHYINENTTEIISRKCKNALKYFLRMKPNRHTFEEVGNYAYSLSKREIEKVSLGLGFKVIAFKGLNDAYLKGVENEKFSEKGPLQRKVKMLILLKDLFSIVKFSDYQLLVAIIFKKIPSKKFLNRLGKEGFKIVLLPDNPYISI